MHVTVDYDAVCEIISELLARWRSTPKRYPFNRPDAIIPQTLIPDELRKFPKVLSNIYLAIDEHMKGRVESAQAFRGHLAIYEHKPWFYDVRYMLWQPESVYLDVLGEYLPIDKVNVARDLRINYQHLYTYYDETALNLLKGVTSWPEALRRVRNKRTKREVREAGHAGQGLYGHQEKMVSMQVYFQDWEGWLKERFPYPSPTDIHNQRIGVAGKGLKVTVSPHYVLRNSERIAGPWRDAVLRYIIEFKEDPLDVADVLWLFSNLMCGNSPLTHTSRSEKVNGSGMFRYEELPHDNGVKKFLHPKYRKALQETCLVCPFLNKCDFAIPARPYYDRGQFVFRPRPKVEGHIDASKLTEPKVATPVPDNHRPLPLTNLAAAE